jgi:phospholipid transport system transporter-binding protein
VTGDLTLATAGNLWRQLETGSLLRNASSVDLGQVGKSDSAGLALLVAWRACRRAGGGDLEVIALPGRLAALARLTDAESIVSG